MKYICEYCGKEYEWINGKSKRFCGLKCTQSWRKENLGKTEIRICKYCGKEYKYIIGEKNRSKIEGGVPLINAELFCSYDCGMHHKAKIHQENCLKKYGVAHILQMQKFKDKVKQTNLEKYGDPNYNNREKCKKTCLEKYGVENPGQFGSEIFTNAMMKKYGAKNSMQVEEIKEKVKQTCIEKYGEDNPAKSKEIQSKTKQTCLEKYGGKAPMCSEKIKEKIKKTNLERYGAENAFQSEEIRNKIKEINLERYGVESVFQAEEIKIKSKQTKLEKYGDENYRNLEKYKQTCLEKYGVEIAAQSEKIKDKIKKTNLERYGAESYLKSKVFKDKYKDEGWLSRKQTKEHNTKLKNHSYSVSKPEEEIYKLLLQKFTEVKRQYRSKKYPFACDFYIPELDLYIEYQGMWTHGREPFNENNKEHLLLVEKWKSKNTNFYNIAIKVWTKSDPYKRNTAKENELNWIEFFNMEEFIKWYNSI